MSKPDQLCRLLNITRVGITARAMIRAGIPAASAAKLADSREMYFGPDGNPLGYWTPEEFVASLTRCVAAIEASQ
jgi:hypothetical protein